MTANEQTFQQIERALRKAASKFLPQTDCLPLTDIYLQVKQESGELLVFDDDDHELTRCVVEEWIGNRDERFYDEVQPILITALTRLKEVTEHVAVLMDSSKIERRSTFRICGLDEVDTVISDGRLPPEFLSACENAGVKVL